MSSNDPMTMKQVVASVAAVSKQLLKNLKRDRDWLWLAGDLRDQQRTRAVLKAAGFRFSRRGRTFDDGVVAHWYNPCGTAVIYRRGRAPIHGGRAAPVAETATDEQAGDSQPVIVSSDLLCSDPEAEFAAMFNS